MNNPTSPASMIFAQALSFNTTFRETLPKYR